MDGTNAIDVIDEYDWIEPVADALAAGVETSLSSAGPLAPGVRNFLHGTWMGHPLHPALTDVPVGAWTVAAALDTAEILGCKGAATGSDASIAIGLVGALASAVTGLTDWHVLQKGSKSRKVGVVHALLNISATLLYGGSLLLRKSNRRGLAKLFSGAGYGLVGISSYLGGILVYEQKIGVDHAPREGFPAEWTAVMPEEELAEENPLWQRPARLTSCSTAGPGQFGRLRILARTSAARFAKARSRTGALSAPGINRVLT
jgi:uncharacterized membrane protein